MCSLCVRSVFGLKYLLRDTSVPLAAECSTVSTTMFMLFGTEQVMYSGVTRATFFVVLLKTTACSRLGIKLKTVSQNQNSRLKLQAALLNLNSELKNDLYN